MGLLKTLVKLAAVGLIVVGVIILAVGLYGLAGGSGVTFTINDRLVSAQEGGQILDHRHSNAASRGSARLLRIQENAVKCQHSGGYQDSLDLDVGRKGEFPGAFDSGIRSPIQRLSPSTGNRLTMEQIRRSLRQQWNQRSEKSLRPELGR
jgi:hypothetical protein